MLLFFFSFLTLQSPLSIQEWRIILLKETLEGLETIAEACASGKPNRRNSSLTCRSSVDGQQELFPCDFTLSFPHFSSPPTFSTLFLYLPLGASLPFHILCPPPPSLFSLLSTTSFFFFLPSSPLHFTLLFISPLSVPL